MIEPNSSAIGLFVAVFVVRLVHELSIGLKRRKLSSEICSLRTQAAAIQKQAAALFTPATFAKCAKLERQSLARDKEAEQKQEELDKLPSTRIALVLRVMKALIWVVAVPVLWGKPLLFMPHSSLEPVAFLFRSPHGSLGQLSGAVAVLPWLSLCDTASSAFMERLMP